jgi:hypothetical protein
MKMKIFTSCVIFLAVIIMPAHHACAERFPSRREAIDKTLDEWELRIHKTPAGQEPTTVSSSIKDMVEIKGYLKAITLLSKDSPSNKAYFGAINRLRLDFDIALTEALNTKITWDNEATAGNILKTNDFNATKTSSQNTFLDLGHTLADNQDLFWDTYLYRGYVKYDKSPFIATLGRQRIAWSVAKIWETVDYFNPINPLSIEPDERAGVDAAAIETAITDNTRVEAVYAPQKHHQDSSIAAKATTLIGAYDLSLIGGQFKQDKLIAFTFDGHLSDGGGLRGELSQVFGDNKQDYQRLNIGYDYTFPNTVYVLFEYLYNGGASGEGLASGSNTSSHIQTKNKHLVGFLVGYDIMPILRAENLMLYDPEQKSIFTMPTIRYSIITNLDCMLGAKFFAGPADSEFGSYQHAYYSWLQWYF